MRGEFDQSGLRLVRLSSERDTTAALEAILFVAAEPVGVNALATALDLSAAATRQQLRLLDRELRDHDRGIALQWHSDTVQLVSAPRFGDLIHRFLRVERTVRLSEAALETLAIIAFRQPVTRGEIEAVRGVDSSGVITTLVSRELIEASGRRPTVGNPIEYATTDTFLRHFGLGSLDELPAVASADSSIDHHEAVGPDAADALD
jgi:segregation and condensation protein B